MSHVLVVPYEPALLERLRGRAVVIRAEARDLAAAAEAGPRFGVHVRWVAVAVPGALTDVALDGLDGAVPVAVRAERLGPFREALRLLPALRRMRARVHLPASSPRNLLALRQLASLGVECAADLDRGSGWEGLADLAAYALLGLAPHAPMQPFAWLADHYRPERRTDFAGAYFDDPTGFLHLDRAGRVALTADDLAAGRFAADRPEQADGVPDRADYRERCDSWTRFFLRADGCSCCPGFRICLGKFEAGGGGCRPFFSELVDLVERAQAARGRRGA